MGQSYSDIDLARYFAGEASPEEVEAIGLWAKSSPQNQEMFDAAKFVWERSENVADKSYDTEHALSKVHGQISFNDTERKIRKFPLQLKVAAVAAVILIPLLILLNKGGNEQAQQVAYEETISGDNIKLVKLPDGSEIWLNSNSKLYTPKVYNRESYRLKLEGEAFFHISRNPRRSCIIETLASTVEVLGTSFNLKARKGDPKNVLSVVEGKVRYAKANSNAEKIVETGNEAAISPNSEVIQVEKLRNNNFLSWKTGIMEFNEEPFRKVIEALESHYQTRFVIADTSLYNIPISTTLIGTPIEKVIELFELTSDEIVFVKTKEGYLVTRKK